MKKRDAMHLNTINWWAFSVLVIYIVFISYRLFFYAYTDNVRNTMRELSYNLLPFRTIINFLIRSQNVKLDVLLYNLVGNIAAFTPLGFLLPAAFGKLYNLRGTLAAAFILIFTAEAVQLATYRGVFDVDDIILNIIGTIIGYFIYKIVKKMW